MYNRLYEHVSSNEILFNKQFGFQKNQSTNDALLQLAMEISTTLDKNIKLGIFVDLPKAFDTVNHEILVSKLQHYGLDRITLKWFSDYLTNRRQCVSLKQSFSKLKMISCGVPQGSNLGLLLFLIYVNDIFNTSTLLNFFLTQRRKNSL